VIANCPACGTHYKHEPPVIPARARCGRCDATIDLSRLRPYRIVKTRAPRPEEAARAARHSPIGLDDPSLATTIAHNVDHPFEGVMPMPAEMDARSVDDTASGGWEGDDPLPLIPEMSSQGMFEPSGSPSEESDRLVERAEKPVDGFTVAHPPQEGRIMTFSLWLVAGAIIGTGASWTVGGTTLTGSVAGALAGALMGWGWLRWTSPK